MHEYDEKVRAIPRALLCPVPRRCVPRPARPVRVSARQPRPQGRRGDDEPGRDREYLGRLRGEEPPDARHACQVSRIVFFHCLEHCYLAYLIAIAPRPPARSRAMNY